MTDLSLYRPNVGVVLFNRAGDIWLGRRAEDDGLDDEPPGPYRWQMPQGGIDRGEDPAMAALRELEEETGVTSAVLLAMTPGWLTYKFPGGFTKKGRIGQRQKWAAMLFEGEDREIDLMAHEPEFDDWRWAALEDAVHEIVPFKRSVYEEVARAFDPLRAAIRAGRIR